MLNPRSMQLGPALRAAIDAALRELGVKRMLLAIHDVSFPSDPDEDVGRGSPYTRASERFLDFARNLGFTGLQLGPHGQTSADNPSPYDATFFSRNVDSLPLRAFARIGEHGRASRKRSSRRRPSAPSTGARMRRCITWSRSRARHLR